MLKINIIIYNLLNPNHYAIKKTISACFHFFFLFIKQFSNAQQSCWCTGQTTYCVDNANDLWLILDPLNPSPPQSGETIGICGTIYLGDLPRTAFPIIIPQGVTLRGNYNMLSGTRIVFPYRYKNGGVCNHQVLPPGEEDETIKFDPDAAMSATYAAFVFAMQGDCHFQNICLQGPKPDIKEEYMYFTLNQVMSVHCAGPPPVLQPYEGLCGGILMRGNNCWIENSEIYGFPYYGVHVRPENPTLNHPLGVGNVHINNSFIHNNKLYGWGYGIFGSGGGGIGCTEQLTACPPPSSNDVLSNSDQHPEQIDIFNTIFMENGKDADGAGHRYSYNFDFCTMGLRANQYIVNQHEYTSICNNWVTTNPANCVGNPTPDCCLPTITHAGGESFSITNSFFLKGANEFNFSYPNTYVPPIAAPCNAVGPVPMPNLTLADNVFFGEDTDLLGRVKIANTDHYNWRYEHFTTSPSVPNAGPLNTLSVSQAPPHKLNEINTHKLFSDASVTGIPHVTVGASLPSWPVYAHPTSPYSIYQGDIIQFHTDIQCIDAHGAASNAGGDMMYMWRFHHLPDDLADELRTEHIDMNGPFEHVFPDIGITNVNLIGLDRSTNTMSYIATHPVTVKPFDDELKLVFNIKDTYDGPWLDAVANCAVDIKKIKLPPGTPVPTGTTPCPNGDCPGYDVTHTTTGFQKYVEINGVTVWFEDVGMDDGGWQRIEYPRPGSSDIPLDQFVCSDDGIAVALDAALGISNACNALSINQDRIEFGLRAMSEVDATIVRGINIYLDDVYINSANFANPDVGNESGPHNENVIANGDFEEFFSNHVPAAWDLPYIINPCPAVSTCYPSWPMPNHNDPKLSAEEVRSGIYSLWARIKYPASDDNFPFATTYPVLMFHSRILPYFSIGQNFSFQQLPPSRKPKPVAAPAIDFTIKPNPSAFGTTLNGSIHNLPANQPYQISIYSPDGTLQYLGTGNTSEFTISKSLPAGVYYVKVWGKGFSNYKRIVVVG